MTSTEEIAAGVWVILRFPFVIAQSLGVHSPLAMTDYETNLPPCSGELHRQGPPMLEPDCFGLHSYTETPSFRPARVGGATLALFALLASRAGSLPPYETIEPQSPSPTRPLPWNRAAGDDVIPWCDQDAACEVLPANSNCTRATECLPSHLVHADSAYVPGTNGYDCASSVSRHEALPRAPTTM